MTLCFLSKQVDHLQSILTLTPRRDVILIARSMIEGLCQLLWAAEAPAILPLQWRAFAWVHDWRVMQGKIKQGQPVDPERHTAIEDALRKYGDQFLTKKAKEAQGRGDALPSDPYHNNWRCGRQIRQICQSVGGDDLYEKIYGPFSDWHHWGVSGLGETIRRQRNRIVYLTLSPSKAVAALACGFQCLLQTVELTDKHLSLSFASRISKVRDGYVTWHHAQKE
jgi:hypothetical protein